MRTIQLLAAHVPIDLAWLIESFIHPQSDHAFAAATVGHWELCEQILHDSSRKSNDRFGIFSGAIRGNHALMAKLAISHGEWHWHLGAHSASEYGNCDMMNLMIAFGIKISDSYYMEWAAMRGHLSFVKMSISYGAPI